MNLAYIYNKSLHIKCYTYACINSFSFKESKVMKKSQAIVQNLVLDTSMQLLKLLYERISQGQNSLTFSYVLNLVNKPLVNPTLDFQYFEENTVVTNKWFKSKEMLLPSVTFCPYDGFKNMSDLALTESEYDKVTFQLADIFHNDSLSAIQNTSM